MLYTSFLLLLVFQDGGCRGAAFRKTEMDPLFWKCHLHNLLSRFKRIRSDSVWIWKWGMMLYELKHSFITWCAERSSVHMKHFEIEHTKFCLLMVRSIVMHTVKQGYHLDIITYSDIFSSFKTYTVVTSIKRCCPK